MNITECFPMKKRRYSIDKTPKRSPRSGKSWHTPRRFTSAADQGLDIIWDNNSPSPRTYTLRKRKKHNGSDSSSSGGEISDLVQKLADKSGATPDLNPPLLNFWMEKGAADASHRQPIHYDTTDKEKKKKIFQTPSRRPRRNLRRNNKTKTKLLSQELQSLVHKIKEEETLLLQQTSKSNRCQGEKLISNTCGSGSNEGEKQEPPTVSSSNQPDLMNSNELVDIWEDDDDIILSQLDISQICNGAMSAYTEIKAPDRETTPKSDVVVLRKTPKTSPEKLVRQTSPDDEFVSQLWELDGGGEYDDDDGLLQSALEDFEKTQGTSACVATTSTTHDTSSLTCGVVTNQSPSPPLIRRDVLKPQNVAKAGAAITCSKLSKSHETHPSIKGTRSSTKPVSSNWVQTEMTMAERCVEQPLQNAENHSNNYQPKKYSKEAIELKKREAQQKRKQKLSQQSAQHKQTQNITTNSQLNRPKPTAPLSLVRRK